MQSMLTPAQKQDLVAQSAWLRPYTRWATRVSINAPAWLPQALRNAPLKLSTLVLRHYQRRVQRPQGGCH